jgi:membrane protein YqaA with SNARE-associated domain
LLSSIFIVIVKPTLASSLLRWLRHLGGPGLILLGLLDSSVIPVPGSMDALTVLLSANQRVWWPYYAFLATTGSVVGGYVTYWLARGEGKGRLERRLTRSQMKKVRTIFAKWGFGAIAIPALLPPPLPMVPFLIVAGATQYSRNKFLAALFLGRTVRYTALAFMAAFYGRQILALISRHTHAVIWMAVALVVAWVALTIFRTKHGPERRA